MKQRVMARNQKEEEPTVEPMRAARPVVGPVVGRAMVGEKGEGSGLVCVCVYTSFGAVCEEEGRWGGGRCRRFKGWEEGRVRGGGEWAVVHGCEAGRRRR